MKQINKQEISQVSNSIKNFVKLNQKENLLSCDRVMSKSPHNTLNPSVNSVHRSLKKE